MVSLPRPPPLDVKHFPVIFAKFFTFYRALAIFEQKAPFWPEKRIFGK
jgi:hypothetical protein